MPVRILIADDSSLARETISGVLSRDPNFTVVGEAKDGYEALELVQSLKPDIVLIDLNMPRCDGLLATRLIKRMAPQVVVVLLTVSDDAADLFEAVRSGAQGYLLKSLPPADWLDYLRGFAEGDWSMPREMADRILSELSTAVPAALAAVPSPEGPAAEARPTERESEILRLVAQAMTNKEIARTLVISEQTVKNHLKNIVQKLQLKNRVDLALYAQRLARKAEPQR